MNEKEFYKQLMSEYSFNHEKIKKAAMSKNIAPGKKKTPIAWISTACAAAAIALTVGTVAVMTPGNPVSVTPTSSVSVEDRFRFALEAYEHAEENTEEVFLYVTFMNKESPTTMQNILARADDTGAIKVVEVYLAEGRSVSGSSNIKELFSLDEEDIVAVKIRCPGNFIKRLTDDKDVYLVETEKPFENSSFSTIDTNVSNPVTPPETQETEPPTPQEETTTATEQTTPEPVIGDTTPVKEEEPTEQQEPASVITSQTDAPALERESTTE